MKELKCPDCDETFESETFEEMLHLLQPHYMTQHADMMKSGTREEGRIWMKKFHEKWEATEEK